MGDNESVFWIVAAWSIGIGFGIWIGIQVELGAVRKEAAEHGVAEWRIDPVTGIESFVWLGGVSEAASAAGEEE